MSDCPGFTVNLADWTDHKTALQAIRREVFVAEQKVPEDEEWDALDAACRHVLAVSNDGIAIGTGRLVTDGTCARIGRMAVLKPWRGRGVGRALLSKLIEMARDEGYAEIRLHAQTHALDFYRKHGFAPHGGEFVEAGIPHYEMHYSLRPPA